MAKMTCLWMITLCVLFCAKETEGLCNTGPIANLIHRSNVVSNLTSPLYDGVRPYLANSIYHWCIITNKYEGEITLSILHLDMEDSHACSHDNLTIYQQRDNVSTEVTVLCGNASEVITFELCCEVEIIFRTDQYNEGTGFVIQYSVVYGKTVITHCTTDYREVRGFGLPLRMNGSRDKEDMDSDSHHPRGFSSDWGIAMVIAFTVLGTALITSLIIACVRERKQRPNVQQIYEVKLPDDASAY